MLAKFVLAVTAIVFTGYGVACMLDPALPANYIGYALTNADAHVEVAAMYGGLQMGVGLYCVLGLVNAVYQRPALMLVLFGIGGLAIVRAVAWLTVAEPVGVYTQGALAYEGATTILAAVALFRR